nr:hypothetical protein [Nanoarchaeum sp.]
MKYTKKLASRLLFIILFLLIYKFLGEILTFLTINLSNLILNLFYPSKIIENSIYVQNQVITFVPACIALTAYSLLFLLIIFTKDIKLKTSVKMFLLGSLFIFVLNLIRIEFLIFLLIKNNYNLFEQVHMLFWNFVSGLYVAFVWIFLVTKYKIKSIPIYSDVKYLYQRINTKRS